MSLSSYLVVAQSWAVLLFLLTSQCSRAHRAVWNQVTAVPLLLMNYVRGSCRARHQTHSDVGIAVLARALRGLYLTCHFRASVHVAPDNDVHVQLDVTPVEY